MSTISVKHPTRKHIAIMAATLALLGIMFDAEWGGSCKAQTQSVSVVR